MARPLLRLFGPPALQGDGDPLVFRPERRFQLLAYLAARGDWVPRDELAHLFWPDQNNASARQNVRWVVYSLRDIAGGLADLSVERERVRFAPDTDVAAFERALSQHLWGDAFELYAGPFVAGLEGGAGEPFGRWVEASRSRFADEFRGAALALGQGSSADVERRIAIGRRLLDDDPYDEQALALSVQGLCAGGRKLQAQRLYQQFCERLLIEMGLEPSAATRGLAREWAHTAKANAEGAAPVAAAPAAASFVGRRDELARIDALLAQPECRLLTIIGAGGIGKSRLAAELLASRGGGEFVSLESLSLPSQIAPQVARRLGLTLQSDAQAEAAVQAHYSDRPALIVLDNFEHVIDGADLLARWLAHCPRLQFVVTSRERLDAAGECLFPLEGLAGPRQGAAPATGSDSDAVRLFVQRARRSSADFDAERELAGICDIVALVEGLPLAIELAAVWTRLLPCVDIAADLRGGLDVLTAADPSQRAEHASMRASFEHSWGLLLPRERELLGRLTVFRGGFTHSAARQVADAALPALAALVDKSLLRSGADGRFSLHPLLHQFASEKLAAEANPKIDVRARHAEYFLATVVKKPKDGAANPSQHLAGIDADFENCLAAWHWSVEEPRFDLLDSAIRSWAVYLESRGRMHNALELFAAAASDPHMAAAPPRLRGDLDLCRSGFLRRVGALAEAGERAHEALRNYRAARDSEGILSCLALLGNTAWQRGEYERAKTYQREGLKRSRVEGDAQSEWKFAVNLAVANQATGDYAGARALFELAASNARQRANLSHLSLTLHNLGNLCIAQQDDASARVHLLESLALAEATGSRLSQPFTLVELAIVDIGAGEFVRARSHVERALEMVRTGADRQVEPMCLYTLARVELESGDLVQARQRLVEAARISLETRNTPNMVQVAIWAAQLFGREGTLAAAVEALSVVLEHPRASTHERRLASEQLAVIAVQLPAAALERARLHARDLTLEGVAQRIIGASSSALPR